MKAIKTKYHGPTNARGSRVKASDEDMNSITIPWDHALDTTENHTKAAKVLCEKMDWHGELVMGSLKDCYMFVFVPTYKGYNKIRV